ncbi:molecular chaperone [Escherichia sp. E13S3]|uniref:fimbrial biogenesis chaperone n=1 Tax=Escherichia sp. E13S3 TaxID=2484854 RepID=UPI0010292137|nr:molecular chaperone [Escherichia sp. E13S3]RZN44881.1 molecular chaperone [Escherichia sp. E13S3]
MSEKFINMRALYFLLIILFVSVKSHADGLSIDHTRVIMSSTLHSTEIVISNTSKYTWLVQSRIVNSSGSAEKLTPSANFYILPPIFKLPSGQSQTVRIIRRQPVEQHNQETLQYIVFKSIPAIDKTFFELNKVKQQLSVSLSLIIKLLSRPAELDVSWEKSVSLLSFTKNVHALTISNTSPYFLTLSRVFVNGTEIALEGKQRMITPFSKIILDKVITSPGDEIKWTIINDQGGETRMMTCNLL